MLSSGVYCYARTDGTHNGQKVGKWSKLDRLKNQTTHARIRGNMPKITANELRKAKACAKQVEKFEHLFPDGVVPTVELCKEHADSFDWDWAAQNLLSPKGLAQYDAARAQAWAEQWIADNQDTKEDNHETERLS